MKKFIFIVLMTAVTYMVSAQTKVLLTVGGKTMTATLVDNEATRELKEILEQGEITIRMNDYGGFEKVGTLPRSLPTSNSQITTAPGDIMLYQGNNMVIFYGSNSWSYTRLGKIDGATESNLKQFLGEGAITLTLSLSPASGITTISSDNNEGKEEIYDPKESINGRKGSVYDLKDVIYDLKGNRILQRPLHPGIYIINGKKTVIKN